MESIFEKDLYKTQNFPKYRRKSRLRKSTICSVKGYVTDNIIFFIDSIKVQVTKNTCKHMLA